MVAPTFESARVCVQRRFPKPVHLELWAEQAMQNPEIPVVIEAAPEFHYEVVAWPPGTVDGGLLPQIGDVLTLPGYDGPFRVIDRALHWPAPTTPEARRGEIRVDLIVQEEQAVWAASRPGRPGEAELRTEGRWLEGTVAQFQTRDSRKLDLEGRPAHQFMSIAFDIPGVGRLHHYVTFAWQARAMFPGAEWGQHPQAPVDQAALTSCLRIGQEFEVNVIPESFQPGTARLHIREVRPPRKPEPEDFANTWDAEANEVTAEAWGEI